MPHELIELLTSRIAVDPNFARGDTFCICVGVATGDGTDWLEVDFTDAPSLALVDLPSEKAQAVIRFTEAQADALCAGRLPPTFSDTEIEGDDALITSFLQKCAFTRREKTL